MTLQGNRKDGSSNEINPMTQTGMEMSGRELHAFWDVQFGSLLEEDRTPSGVEKRWYRSSQAYKDAWNALASHITQRAGETGWRPIESAPKDGTAILAWCVHPNARYAGDPKEWACAVVTQWTDHNGGGWTWNGMAGTFTHWMPLPAAPVDDGEAVGP